MEVLGEFVKTFVLPPAGPLLLAIVGLALITRKPRVGRILAWTGLALLFALSLPIVAWWLLQPFQSEPLDMAQASRAQAIVILGGGVRQDAPEYGGPTLGRLTAERVRYGARVARATGLPVLVSGGIPARGRTSEAQVMRQALEDEYGVAVRWVEAASRNTHQNAALSARLLQTAGVTTVVLVAHAADMPRARGEFADAGIDTIAAATGLFPRIDYIASDFLPSAAALQLSYHALYEHAANLARSLGR